MGTNDIALIVIFGTLIILLLTAGVAITISLGYRKAQAERIKATSARLQYEQELRNIEGEVQEATLTYIAGELHDNVGQHLTFTNLQIEKGKLLYPDAAHILAPISESVQTTMEQIRLLSHSLSSELITSQGLQQLIEHEIKRLCALGKYKIDFSSDDTEPNLNKDTCIIVFRIFQEILSNIVRHACASCIQIKLYGHDTFFLEVADDGKGFNKEDVMSSSSGLGLKNLLRRVSLAGLQCNIDAVQGKGTRFTLLNNASIA